MSPGSYVYTVVAHDGAGNSSLASNARTVVYDVTAPGTPTGLAAPTPTNAKPTLLWTTTTDTGGSGIARYEVYRTPPGGSATLAGTTSVGSFTDASVTVSGVYAYTVRAVDGAGNAGASSSSINVMYDNAAPSAPTALAGTSPTASPPVLTWAASTDTLSGVDHYDVLRGGTKINSSPITALTYTDSSPIASSQTYTVRAVDAAGNVGVASSAKVVVYDPNPPSAPVALGSRRDRRRSRAQLDGVDRSRGRIGSRGLPRLPRRHADRDDDVDHLHRQRLGRRAGHVRVLRRRLRRRRQHDPLGAEDGRRRHRRAGGPGRGRRGRRRRTRSPC